MTSSAQREDPNAAIIAEFRTNAGEVAAPYPDPPPMLLLHTIGARSGRRHVVPMRCLLIDGVPHVFGSAHGSTRHPDWYYNLRAHPDIDIEWGREIVPVHAQVLEGAERDSVFNQQAARFPIFHEYQARLRRTIPVLRLAPRRS